MAKKVAVIGLGYVGLPLATALANKGHTVLGYDILPERIQELRQGKDRSGEVCAEDLVQNTLSFHESPESLKDADIFIITVPTPVDIQNLPVLGPLQQASKMVGELIAGSNRKIVVFESTVYPGVTENICGKIIEESAGLKCGEDFILGYAPERMNPGDKEHNIASITKVVSAQTKEVATLLADLYGQLNDNNVFVAKNIQTAEAAKVIENAQRDINIAFINEVTTIFKKLGLSIYDVLEAAETKWNFLPFKPGLVGGHCIGVDPYYLAQCAKNLGHQPDVILAGRRMNNMMSRFIGESIHENLEANGKPSGRLLLLGLTFKENVSDLRNSKVKDLINFLKQKGHAIEAVDPHADEKEVRQNMGIESHKSFDTIVGPYDAIVLTVPHKAFHTLTPMDFKRYLPKGGYIFDVKGLYLRDDFKSQGLKYWSL